MKQWLLLILFSLVVVTHGFALGKPKSESSAQVLQELMRKQKVTWPRQLNMKRISDAELLRLGRALWKETAGASYPKSRDKEGYRVLARQYLRGIPGSSGFDECYGRFGMMGGMMNGWGYGIGNGSLHWIGGIIMWLLFLALIAVVIYFLAKGGGVNIRELKGGGENALDILKKRYARGEITKEEFEQTKKDLQ